MNGLVDVPCSRCRQSIHLFGPPPREVLCNRCAYETGELGRLASDSTALRAHLTDVIYTAGVQSLMNMSTAAEIAAGRIEALFNGGGAAKNRPAASTGSFQWAIQELQRHQAGAVIAARSTGEGFRTQVLLRPDGTFIGMDGKLTIADYAATDWEVVNAA